MLRTSRPARIALVLAAISAPLVLAERGFAAQKAAPESKPARPVESKSHKRSAAIEASIRDGLCWLARHQNPDGSWSALTLASRCESPEPIYRPTRPYAQDFEAGLTGLAILAFLGSMRAPDAIESLKDPVTDEIHALEPIVRKGLASLIARQRADGSFSSKRVFVYCDAFATQAVCSFLDVTGDASFTEPAQKAIDFLQAAQRPNPTGKGLWGWRYASRQEIEEYHKKQGSSRDKLVADLYDVDTSVTGRCMVALRVGARAGLVVKQAHLDGGVSLLRFASSTDEEDRPTGLVGYFDAKGAGMKVTGPDDQYAYHPSVMSALGVQILCAAGANSKDPFLLAAAQQLMKDLPIVSKDRLTVDYYYWHNGTRALSLLGGPGAAKREKKFWPAWNKSVSESVMSLQDRSDKDCTHGGWMVEDRWTFAQGGPIYTTALNVLTLQECE